MRLSKRFTEVIRPVHPYNFELTVHKPAGWSWLSPEEIYEKGTLWTATRVGSLIIGLKLKSLGTLNRPEINCEVLSNRNLKKEKSSVMKKIRTYLGADEDIREFCTIASRDSILRETVKKLCGMRDATGDLFSSLLLATTLQMAPIKRSEQMMDLLIKNYGDVAVFDRKKILMWPSAERIARVSVRDLRRKCKLGYRAKNLKAIAKALVKGFPDVEELAKMTPEDAKEKLMELQGIGEYSVGIVSPHPEFPADSWSARIFYTLFFGKKKYPTDVIEKVREEAERRWGKWKGHAFVYVLNDLKSISERYGVDFTGF